MFTSKAFGEVMESAPVYDLSRSEFFKHFPKSELRRLELHAAKKRFKKNTLVINNGDDCHSAYVLISGSAYAFTDDESGNEFVFNTIQADDCFGELGVLDDLPRTASVITTSDSECLVIPKVELMKSIAAEPQAALAVIKLLVGRIRGMTEDVSCLALMDVYGRMTRVLNSEAVVNKEGTVMTPRLTHQELANRVGSSREMVSKILMDLKIGNYIDTVDRRIQILKKLPEKW